MGTPRLALARLEVIADRKTKRWFKVLYTGVGLSMLALLTLTVLKATKHVENVQEARNYVRANVAVATLCTIANFGALFAHIIRHWQVKRAGFIFTPRRWRIQCLLLAYIGSQTVNSLFYLVPNAYIANNLDIYGIPTCGSVLRWSQLVRHTMWNNIFLVFLVRARMFNLWVDKDDRPVGREDGLLIDAPLRTHWPLFSVWFLMEGFIVFNFWYSYVIDHEWVTVTETTCVPKGVLLGTTAALAACFLAYQLLAVFYVYRSYQQLQRKPYNLFRWTNVAVRMHYVEVGVMGDFLTLSIGLLWFVRFKSCSTMVLIWIGVLPAQLAMSIWAVVSIILVMPSRPTRALEVNIDKCRLKWTEKDLEDGSRKQANGTTQSFFCFERMLKCWYWSLCAYGYDPKDQQCKDPGFEQLNLGMAKDLYNLKHHDYFRSDVDNRVLISWSSETIVISFRGTYSAANVWSDLQCWRVFHPPQRGNYFFRTAPLVHKGFLHSWTFDGFNHKILNKVIQITHSPEFDKPNMKVVVTGHSLGGAVAVLCAYDIATHCGLTSDQISCYTFGAPRVGNHAFVEEYNARVPNTWQVINDQDVVPSMPKFWLLFKHAGERVIINPAGDMIIAPLFVEVTLYKCFKFFGAPNPVGQHFLLSYLKSVRAIVEAQFIKQKALPGGVEAMREMFIKHKECSLMCEALGIDFATFGEQMSLACKMCESIKGKKSVKKKRLIFSVVGMVSQWSSGSKEYQNGLEDENGSGSEVDGELGCIHRHSCSIVHSV